MASVRRHQELPPRRIQPVPAAPTDPLLAKAEPIRDAGGASVITYLRKGEKYCAAAVRRGSKKM